MFYGVKMDKCPKSIQFQMADQPPPRVPTYRNHHFVFAKRLDKELATLIKYQQVKL